MRTRALPRIHWRVIHHIHPDAIDSMALPIRAVSSMAIPPWPCEVWTCVLSSIQEWARRTRVNREDTCCLRPTKCQRMPWILLSLLQKGMPKQLKFAEARRSRWSASHPNVKDMTHHVILIHRDLSTFERIESIQDSWSIEETPFRRFQYIVFVPGPLSYQDGMCQCPVEDIRWAKGRTLRPTSMMVHASILWPRETGKIGSNPGFRRMHDLILHDGSLQLCCNSFMRWIETNLKPYKPMEATHPSFLMQISTIYSS